MPYITREDGERFVIPSYRDTITARKTSVLKREVAVLSANYGEYIALQRKSASEYEIAFSPDAGYLLGECVWDNFKRPYDMIYCEAIPNTQEAYLVIVKFGTVYLDGTFPIDSISEELVIFKTQQNNFSIYISGDVPVSETPEDGKFSFDESSISSFEVLPEPIFPTLPVVKAFQLQPVDTVLKNYGIGTLPIKQIAAAVVLLGIAYMVYGYVTSNKQLPEAFTFVAVNPYQGYLDALTSPDPVKDIRNTLNAIQLLYTIPGWTPSAFTYELGFPARLHATLTATDIAHYQLLLDWAHKNNAHVDITATGATVTVDMATGKRDQPTVIYPIQSLVATLLDRFSYLLPPGAVSIGLFPDKKPWKNGTISITFANVSPFVVDMIAQYIQGLPMVTTKFTGSLVDNTISGTITFNALGN
jgi:hypothetical protein